MKKIILSFPVIFLASIYISNFSYAQDVAKGQALPKLTPREIYDRTKYGQAIIYTTVKIDTTIKANATMTSTASLPEKFEVVSRKKGKNGEEFVLMIMEKVAGSDTELRYSGSGWFADKDGTLATDMHVIKEENDKIDFGFAILVVKEYSYEIRMLDRRTENNPNGPSQRRYRAEFLGGDFNRDTGTLKVLDINPKDYDMMTKGNSDKMRTTDEIFTLGSPHGIFDSWGAPGTVSATHRLADMWFIEDFIQTTIPIRPGNSGSPVFNDSGEVIAMVDLSMRGGDNMGFATASNLIDVERLKSLKGNVIKKVSWGADALLEKFVFMGDLQNLDIQDLNEINSTTGLIKDKSLHSLVNVIDNHWAILTKVESGSLAEKAGLKQGDVVTKVKNKDIVTGMQLRIALSDILPNEEFELTYQRIDNDGVVKELTTKIKFP